MIVYIYLTYIYIYIFGRIFIHCPAGSWAMKEEQDMAWWKSATVDLI